VSALALPEAIAHYAFSTESFELERRRNPLDYYQGNGIGTDKLLRYIAHPDVDEVWWVSSNSGGKTYNCSALGVSFALNRPYLDGRRIPQFGWTNVGWVNTQSYKQQVDSSQKAYLEHIGEHPHDISWVDYGKGYIDTLYVAGAHCTHGTARHCLRCSRIVFMCEQSDADVGGRIDWSHIDEPCSKRRLDEIRARRQAGRMFKRFASVTFLKRSDWEWWVRDLEGCEDTPRRDLNRVWYRTVLRDNKMLSAEDIRKFEADFARSDLRDARLYGLLVDVDSDCPLDIAVLQQLKRRCVRGLDIPFIVNAQTQRGLANVIAPTSATVEQWWKYEQDEEYCGLLDPSQGIKSVRRDPGALHIYALRQPRLVARYSGYIGAYGLGGLAVRLLQDYGDARCDIDMTGGYGTATVVAMQQLGFTNFHYEIKHERARQTQVQIGYRIHATNRGDLMANLQEFCTNPDVMVLSAEVFDSLMGLSIDFKGKIAAVEGSRFKDDDAVCLARARYHMKSPWGRAMTAPIREAPWTSSFEEDIARAHGRTAQLEDERRDDERGPMDRSLDR
jgi:hypothetical protein